MVADGEWIQQDCSKAVNRQDSRTPGLFKEKFSGAAMVALKDIRLLDHTHKGGLNTLEGETYKQVLATRNPYIGTNIGFRFIDNSMHTYRQEHAGLPYYYRKRQVSTNCVSTKPLNLEFNFS